MTCGHCGESVPTSANPLFAGYARPHNRPGKDWNKQCPGMYHHHGRPVAERTGLPGWVPFAHVIPGDTIRVHENARPYCTDYQVLYTRPWDHGKLHVGWLIPRGMGGTFTAPGEAVLLVRPAVGPSPQPHSQVVLVNAISRRGHERHCYRTRAEADETAATRRPWNNTLATVGECWKTDCFDAGPA